MRRLTIFVVAEDEVALIVPCWPRGLLPMFVEFLQGLFLGGIQIVVDAFLVDRDQSNLCRRPDIERNHSLVSMDVRSPSKRHRY